MSPVWRRFYAFLLGPALVAAAAVGVFTLATVITEDSRDPAQLVDELRSGGEHRRWQAAFALTKYLQPSMRADGDAIIHRESDDGYREKLEAVRVYVPQLLEIYDDPERGDPKVRRFLALAFSYLGDPRVLEALDRSLGDSDIELVHYALAAIARAAEEGHLGDEVTSASTRAAVLGASRRPEPDLRATAVFVLGVLGGEPAMGRLSEAVVDPAPAVRWNAAFGLARQGDSGGEEVLLEILDRGPLYDAAGDQARKDDLFLNAVRSAGMVRTPLLQERLARIAKNDANPRARDMAIKLLEQS